MEDEDVLSPEEIAAATRKVVPSYYAYYDTSTGEITDVASSLLQNKETFLQISFEVFEKFMTGQEQFKDWVVTRTKNSTNEFGVDIVSRINQTQTFKNNMFEHIVADPDSNTEITAHCDHYNKKWIFIMSDSARQKVYDNRIGTRNLSFFVTRTTSFNFLVRTITITVNQLISDKVEIPFESELELGDISLSTKHAFDNYALVIWKIDEQQDTNN